MKPAPKLVTYHGPLVTSFPTFALHRSYVRLVMVGLIVTERERESLTTCFSLVTYIAGMFAVYLLTKS